MNISAKTADKIAERYDRSYSGMNDFWDELRHLVRERGLDVLKDDARRDLIVALGKGRRRRECRNIKSRAEYAAARAAIPLAAE